MQERIEALQGENARLKRRLRELEGARVELKTVNQQLSLILAQQPIIPYTCKAEGDFGATYISPSVQAITGYLPDEMTRDSSFWANRIHPDDAETVFGDLGKLFEHHHHEHEYRWRIADGSYLWFYDCLRLICDEQGRPKYIVGAWMDITKRKQFEQRVQEQNEFLDTLMDTVPDVIFAQNERGQFTLANRACCEWLGVSESDLLGRTGEEALADGPARALCELAARVIQTGEPAHGLHRFVGVGGDESLLETVVVPHGGTRAVGIGAIAVGRDVTQREAAKTLQEAKEKAEFASRAKTEFLANMSHEITHPAELDPGLQPALGPTRQCQWVSGRDAGIYRSHQPEWLQPVGDHQQRPGAIQDRRGQSNGLA